ncbi:MAG: hypothetical protein AMS18_09915 [Gemmatimonas sp. SG8_17]|nr:MAG: hypothetical protein AMS18_09915 [Gemmatimonas sp. SG8_17]
MKRLLGGIALAALILGLGVASATAQMQGFVNYPAIGGVGVKISGDYGRGLNDDALKSNYFGGRAELGIPFANFWAGIGSVKPDSALTDGASSEMTYGGGASFNLLKGPLVPVQVAVQAGFGYLKSDLGDNASAKLTKIPFGLSAAINVPTTGVGIKPWAYAFGEYQSRSVTGFDSENKIGFGISGGIEVNLQMGLGLYAALNWSTVDFGAEGETDTKESPLFLGAGLTYKIQVPSLGM